MRVTQKNPDGDKMVSGGPKMRGLDRAAMRQNLRVVMKLIQENGDYLVTAHNGRLKKYAKVDKPIPTDLLGQEEEELPEEDAPVGEKKKKEAES